MIEASDGVANDGTTAPEAKDIQYEPMGTLCDFRTLYQTEPDAYGKHSWVKEPPLDLPEPVEDAESAQYALLVRKQKCYDGRRSLSIHSIAVQSERLKEFLKQALKNYPGVTPTLQRLEFKSPFRPFVHRWEAITKFRVEEQDPTTKAHVELFYRIMDEELRDVIDRKKDLIAKGVITHDLAWTILEPQDVVLSSSGGLRAYSLTHESEAGLSETEYFTVQYVDFDGSKFGYVSTGFEIPKFAGTLPITSLPIFPLKYHPEKDMVKDLLAARGEKWEKYKGYHFKSYEKASTSMDPESRDNNLRDTKHFVKSRVIIDAEGYKLSGRMRALSRFDEQIGGELDNAQRLIATPILYGYSLDYRQWDSFHVDGLKDIEWDEQAFDSLVLPREQRGLKEVILAVAKAHSNKVDAFDDVVRGKGHGFIIQLSGPPGVGKTLTAESVAEVMKVPLYVMSAGDLGVDARGFENKLTDILQMIPRWGALLLLDEADVFMETRDSANLARNELVSIFLRMIEYYEGILFLTTNRTQNIDPAFGSRIHLSLTYKELDVESRRQVWIQFLNRSSNNEAFTDEQLNQVAELQLNGRQIKNVIKTASLLAWSKERELRYEDLKMVLALRNSQK
ncbi:ATPase AAA-type core [Penicillium cf. griseofulvum]|uniref:ATPase AAA-type core n=1 Tax=Penicillium cf. griseofulvum TaxID=2972120 RepID=A0A9W9T1F6_9EURO|nr:ATPase AAA-type core [Penicillium cf. griseofulvum]KAJ5441033.1 ATPase AAA-type core [Penicillium cf. griseofulvum]KAJ5449080.1 ATPase AAA-type core [Penicillium cf. griseofulvum]